MGLFSPPLHEYLYKFQEQPLPDGNHGSSKQIGDLFLYRKIFQIVESSDAVCTTGGYRLCLLFVNQHH